MQSFVRDVRYGFRLLMRTPGFALASIAMLALGVGSSTAIFGIVESVLLRPLPFPDSGRIVTLSGLDEAGRAHAVSLPDFTDWAAQSRSFEALAAARGSSSTVVTSRQSRRIYAVRFHADLLRVYGMPLGHGRAPSLDEIRAGEPSAVVPDGFAKGLWGDAAKAIGEAIELEGVRFTVVGVLAPASDERTDLFVPAAAFGPDTSTRRDYVWQVLGRLRDDVSLRTARGEMQTIAGRLRAEHGTAAAGIAVSSLLDDTVRGVRPALIALLAAGGLLLLIACANVANLLLARSVGRRREIAVRLALGAGRGRVVRQLLVESLPIAVLSAAAGIAIARWSFSGLLAAIPFGLPRRAQITMDSTALLFGLAASLGCGLLFALAPAIRIPGGRLSEHINTAARGSSARDGLLHEGLVVGQFALALAVLSCAGLLTRSFVHLARVDTGFDYSQALVAETELPESRYATGAQLNDFWRTAMDRVRGLPGVEAVGLAESAPFEGGYPNGSVELLDDGGRQGRAWYGIATTGLFEALKIPVRQGRTFDDRDSPTAPHAAVINQLAAERLWPGQNPIGRRLRWIDRRIDPTGEPLTVVGVIANVRHNSLTVDPVPEVYAHFHQRPTAVRDADLVVRATNAAALTPAVRRELLALDRDLPIRFHTLSSSYAESLAQPRFLVMLIGFFAACALLLAAAGLYSSMAYSVSRQRREIGIRLALGSAPGALRQQVLMRALRIAAAGAVLGAFLGAAGGRLIANYLFGVRSSDPAVFVTAALALATTALLAAYVPARRASRTDPTEALRCE